MTIFLIKRLAFIVLLVLVVGACSESQQQAEPLPVTYKYTAPSFTDDGWQVGHLSDFGFDEPQITQLVDDIQQKILPGIDSISIVRDNTLLLHENIRTSLSEYDDWIDNSQLDRHIMHSTSKSFVSALVGIAIEQGFISSTETPFYDFFDYPDYDNWDPRKRDITLADVLTMKLGLEWDEWTHPYDDERNSLTRLVENKQDFVKALLDLPVTDEPGSSYAYNTIASIALGAVVERSTNIPLQDFAQQYLFTPLQIKNAEWLMTPTNQANTGSGLFLQTRDMAKFGQLYLDRGIWNGIQMMDPDWIRRSLEKHVTLNWDYTTGYGFQWWLGNFKVNNEEIPFYSTRGFGSQFIVIVPDYNLVIAFTANNYDNDLYDSPFTLIEEYILPAINS